VSFLTQLKSPKVPARHICKLVIRLHFVPFTPSLQAQDVNSHTSPPGISPVCALNCQCGVLQRVSFDLMCNQESVFNIVTHVQGSLL